MTESKQQLKAFVERIERLEEDKKAVGKDISDVYSEAEGNGFDKKALRVLIKKRAADKHELEELEALVSTYEAALGSS